jgi:hypothetical protein
VELESQSRYRYGCSGNYQRPWVQQREDGNSNRAEPSRFHEGKAYDGHRENCNSESQHQRFGLLEEG